MDEYWSKIQLSHEFFEINQEIRFIDAGGRQISEFKKMCSSDLNNWPHQLRRYRDMLRKLLICVNYITTIF